VDKSYSELEVCLGDDHVMDLAVACGVQHLVTHNLRDLQRGELRFSSPREQQSSI
jgi:hypothetical protein